jgi:hypothetical protein
MADFGEANIMANDVAKLVHSTEVQAAPNVSALPTAVEQVMAGLKDAVAAMRADDISVELSASQEGHRTSARFSLRAYRRGEKVIDEQRDV